MLTKPVHGWTDFHLDETGTYGLSYLDDIPFEWLEQAIHGLETMLPFCVKGFLEPGRFLCLVSYWNCYVTIEAEERRPRGGEAVGARRSVTSMLEFCNMLYEDISADLEGWASFVDYRGEDFGQKKRLLIQRLQRLKELIEEREELFDENRCFL